MPQKARPIATFVANRLQDHYETHRVPETWGTPSVSHYVFNTLRQDGFLAASKELSNRMRGVGIPELSIQEKIAALVVGIGLVTLANTLLSQGERPEIIRRESRTFSPGANKAAVLLYTLGATLLVAANEHQTGTGGEGEEGNGGSWEQNPDGSWSRRYPDSDTSTEYRIYGRPDEGDGAREIYDTDAFDDLDQGDTDDPGPN